MTFPDFKFENSLWKKGYDYVGGIDEVGRGCFAGPVVAGIVIFKKGTKLSDISVSINDSKKMTPKQREVADIWIRKNALRVGVGTASVSQINKVGIKKATEMAFRRAIKNCEVKPNFILIDAFYIPYVKGLRRRNQKAIVKGDTKVISISAASIVAKVYRDKLMVALSQKAKFKKYGWEKNKGYGTKTHRDMILKYGICKLHRRKFVETWMSKG